MISPCQKLHVDCGHKCSGVGGELDCPPCLKCLGTTADLCSICFTSELGAEPVARLGCGHLFHAECVQNLMKHKWSTLRINFDFLSCPTCKKPISSLRNVPQLKEPLRKLFELKSEIVQKAQKVKLKTDLDMAPVSQTQGRYYGREVDYLLAKCAFYECWQCKKPFYGGLIDCERELRLETTTTKEDLLCKGCVSKKIDAGSCYCQKHGHKHITWKCCFCCSEALFRCGMTYFCDPCHSRGGVINDCGGVDCPLGVTHPPASREPLKAMFPLGCSLCRKAKALGTSEIKEIDFAKKVAKPNDH